MQHVVTKINNYPPKVLKREIEKPIYRGEVMISRLRRTLKLEFPFLSTDEIRNARFEKLVKPSQ